MAPQPPGGPFQITVQVAYKGALSTIIIQDVLFGEVWVASGQSNMVFGVPGTFNSSQECAAASLFPNVRLFALEQREADSELADVAADAISLPWTAASAPGALCGAPLASM